MLVLVALFLKKTIPPKPGVLAAATAGVQELQLSLRSALGCLSHWNLQRNCFLDDEAWTDTLGRPGWPCIRALEKSSQAEKRLKNTAAPPLNSYYRGSTFL